MPRCVFCEVVAGRAPAQIVHQDDLVTAFRDLRPQAPVHILIVPNEHIASVADVGEAQAKLLGRIVGVANALAAREGIAGTGFRLVINRGPDAGQSVDHLHVHLIGGRRLGWPPG